MSYGRDSFALSVTRDDRETAVSDAHARRSVARSVPTTTFSAPKLLSVCGPHDRLGRTLPGQPSDEKAGGLGFGTAYQSGRGAFSRRRTVTGRVQTLHSVQHTGRYPQ